MNIYELFIRFSMINGHKLSKIKKLASYDLDPNNISAENILNSLGFNEQQKMIFKQINNQKIEGVLNWLDKPDHHLIPYIDHRYPLLLKEIHTPPLMLFVKGNVDLLSSPQIAMVGSRQFSHYGAQWSRYFAGQLAANGLTITSGLALGIDALCHRGALDAKGNTIAVLGSGLKKITPRGHLSLAQDILHSNGAIISEFLPDESARPEYFPRRNRIISGLSLATFVVEASQKSGSLITARYALEQNRDVFALPGDISNENYHGVHHLIQQGAYLVTKPTDILEHINCSTLHWLTNSERQTDKESHKPSLKKWREPLFDEKNFPHPEIFAMIEQNPIPIDIIAQKLSISITDLTIKLLDLELSGAIKSVNGGYIRCQINNI